MRNWGSKTGCASSAFPTTRRECERSAAPKPSQLHACCLDCISRDTCVLQNSPGCGGGGGACGFWQSSPLLLMLDPSCDGSRPISHQGGLKDCAKTHTPTDLRSHIRTRADIEVVCETCFSTDPTVQSSVAYGESRWGPQQCFLPKQPVLEQAMHR